MVASEEIMMARALGSKGNEGRRCFVAASGGSGKRNDVIDGPKLKRG
jgi:hypothetical protein